MNVAVVCGALVFLAVMSAFSGKIVAAFSREDINVQSENLLLRTGTKLSNEESKELLRKTIIQADLNIEPEYFIGLQFALVAITLLVLIPLVMAGMDIFFIIPPVIVVFLLPKAWLNGRARKRVAEIENALPDFCVSFATVLSAGADFLTSVTEVASNMQGELGKEFLRAVDNMAVGDNRSKALGDLAARCGVPDLTELVRKIDQSQRYGSPLAEAVKLHSEQMMLRRRYDMQEKAGKLSIKLLPVIALSCVVPMLGLLLYPILYHLGTAFG